MSRHVNIPAAQKMLAIFDEGISDYKSGRSLSHCPYDAGTDEADQWEDGWFQNYNDCNPYGNDLSDHAHDDFVEDDDPCDDYDDYDFYEHYDLWSAYDEDWYNEHG